MTTRGRWPAIARALAAAPLLLAIPQVRDILESRMALHMGVELPLLLAAGWAAAALWGEESMLGRQYDELDAHGLLGMALVTGLSLFWMLPVSLDMSLLSVSLRLVKYGSWWASGFALRRTWPRLADESHVFFFGTLSWMLATAGLLYQSSDRRLCVNYLLDDQLIAGRVLVAAALVLGAGALFRLARPSVAGTRLSRSAASAPAVIVAAFEPPSDDDSPADAASHQS